MARCQSHRGHQGSPGPVTFTHVLLFYTHPQCTADQTNSDVRQLVLKRLGQALCLFTYSSGRISPTLESMVHPAEPCPWGIRTKGETPLQRCLSLEATPWQSSQPCPLLPGTDFKNGTVVWDKHLANKGQSPSGEGLPSKSYAWCPTPLSP